MLSWLYPMMPTSLTAFAPCGGMADKQQLNAVWRCMIHCSLWTRWFADFATVAKSSGSLPLLFCALPAPGAALLKITFQYFSRTHTHAHKHTCRSLVSNASQSASYIFVRARFLPGLLPGYYYLIIIIIIIYNNNNNHHHQCGYHAHVIFILLFCTVLARNKIALSRMIIKD
jgi:hypothetical protein